MNGLQDDCQSNPPSTFCTMAASKLESSRKDGVVLADRQWNEHETIAVYRLYLVLWRVLGKVPLRINSVVSSWPIEPSLSLTISQAMVL